MMVATLPPREGDTTTSSFFRETRDLPRFEEHGYVSRHVSEKSLEAAWQARVRYHNMNGRPRHSKRVLEWNGHYVLYDLHLPPGASLPVSAMPIGSVTGAAGSSISSSVFSMSSSGSSESSGSEDRSTGGTGPPPSEFGLEHDQDSAAKRTSACKRRTIFRSNGGLVSPNGRYTFVQHNDNELVIYDREGGKIWSCPGSEAVDVRNPEAEKEMNTVFTEFQHDGTLVQYAERKSKGWGGQGREMLWRSHSAGPAQGNRLVMQDDGNLVIYNSKTLAVAWESGTAENGGPNRIILR
ncbi:unnamed protein product [Scytosiphon promiscuus]